jgi:hypothetical protein
MLVVVGHKSANTRFREADNVQVQGRLSALGYIMDGIKVNPGLIVCKQQWMAAFAVFKRQQFEPVSYGWAHGSDDRIR